MNFDTGDYARRRDEEVAERYCQICYEHTGHLPDAPEFIQYLIAYHLPRGRPARLTEQYVFIKGHYDLDISGVGDYIDDLCLLYVNFGPPATASYRRKSGRQVVDKLYAEWKYLNVNNAGVPSDF